MPGKKVNKQKAQPTALRGVIDQVEGDFLVIAFDDEQRLDWPRRFAPPEAKSSDAVTVQLAPADDSHWSGESDASGKITLGKNQALYWPGEIAAGPIALILEIDSADTAARKERVRGLIDDIFKQK
jgi:hypothetical protein